MRVQGGGRKGWGGERARTPAGQSPSDKGHSSCEREHSGLALKSELIAKSHLFLLCSP